MIALQFKFSCKAYLPKGRYQFTPCNVTACPSIGACCHKRWMCFTG